jgi:hypothetical protein
MISSTITETGTHVLVGPPGVFLLDSKPLHGTSAAGNDSLRSGRLVYAGGALRGGARDVNQAIELRLGWRAPWVQAVVVVWGDFPHNRRERRKTSSTSGERSSVAGLPSLPEKINAPQRAALAIALREVRAALPRREAAPTMA